MVDDTEIKASREPAKNGYGQNGYQGASSLVPGEQKPGIANRVAPPEPAPVLSNPSAQRPIKADGFAPAHGMRSRSGEGGKVPMATDHRKKN